MASDLVQVYPVEGGFWTWERLTPDPSTGRRIPLVECQWAWRKRNQAIGSALRINGGDYRLKVLEV